MERYWALLFIAFSLLLIFAGCAPVPVQETPPASPGPRPEDVYPEDVYNDTVTGMEFVFVKGGCFEMGDTFGDGYPTERPVHEVCVDGFWMGKHEVTQGQWVRIMGNNPSYFKSGDNYPVEQVSWNDVQEYISRLNQQTRKKFRLPTEAKWEYAARSGGKKKKCAGRGCESYPSEYAWYDRNSGSKTHPVAQKRPNGLGLYDMSGNVYEWCQDWYHPDYYRNSPRNNPEGPILGGPYRVRRGGCWLPEAWRARASYRSLGLPTVQDNNVGFRIVLPSR